MVSARTFILLTKRKNIGPDEEDFPSGRYRQTKVNSLGSRVSLRICSLESSEKISGLSTLPLRAGQKHAPHRIFLKAPRTLWMKSDPPMPSGSLPGSLQVLLFVTECLSPDLQRGFACLLPTPPPLLYSITTGLYLRSPPHRSLP